MWDMDSCFDAEGKVNDAEMASVKVIVMLEKKQPILNLCCELIENEFMSIIQQEEYGDKCNPIITLDSYSDAKTIYKDTVGTLKFHKAFYHCFNGAWKPISDPTVPTAVQLV